MIFGTRLILQYNYIYLLITFNAHEQKFAPFLFFSGVKSNKIALWRKTLPSSCIKIWVKEKLNLCV